MDAPCSITVRLTSDDNGTCRQKADFLPERAERSVKPIVLWPAEF